MINCLICDKTITHGSLCSNCYRRQSNAYAKLSKNLTKIALLKDKRTKNEERFHRFSNYVNNVYEAREEIREFKQAK